LSDIPDLHEEDGERDEEAAADPDVDELEVGRLRDRFIDALQFNKKLHNCKLGILKYVLTFPVYNRTKIHIPNAGKHTCKCIC
jgi:hypothetical protein